MSITCTYQVLLFDLIGVLVQGNDAVTEIMSGWTGLSDDQLWQFWLESPTVRDFDSGRIGAVQFSRGLVSELDLPIPPEEFLEIFRRWLRGPYVGVKDLLAKLDGHYRLACFSNLNEEHWPLVRDDFGMGDILQDYFISYQMGMLKPDEDGFRYVLQQMNVDPAKVAFFDDNEVDCRVAANLGMDAFLTKCAGHLELRLQSLGII